MRLAKYFEHLVLSDARFEILGKVVLGLVCFRLKGGNDLSQNLLFVLNDSGKIHMVPSMLDDKYVIRFCVNAKNANDDDMECAWELIKTCADTILKQSEAEAKKKKKSEEESKLLAEELALAASVVAVSAASGSSSPGGGVGLSSSVSASTTSEMKRIRFGISKMVSEPRPLHRNRASQRRTLNGVRFDSDSSRKYLARKCSVIVKSEDEDDF